VSVNANCKPPHAADTIAERLSVIGNSIFEEGTKAEWFFDESRASVRQQWAADRKSARPQVRDQDFLAKNTTSGGVSVSCTAPFWLFDSCSTLYPVVTRFLQNF
jgi:hypothetical protein